MKLKNIFCAVAFAATVVMGISGCGNEKSKETTEVEIKKISEEEIYEQLVRVEEKAKKIEEARLNMDQEFQKKWDLLKRKQAIADRAFSKNDYNATFKFLQEAEAAADWIMNKDLSHTTENKKMREVADAKKAANAFFAKASAHYPKAEMYERQGKTAYKTGDFEEAARLFDSATVAFRQALGDFVPHYFVRVEADTFSMGDKNGDNDEKPVHQVTLTKPFYIAKHEVTQAQWLIVMGNNPSYRKGEDHPVDSVNWNDAMAFCKKLNDYGYAPKGYKFTLPTEAQWEFAARGGNKSKGYKYSGGNNLDDVAWYKGNSGELLHKVGQKQPNELGLYDMSGNVWEWCLDWYSSYNEGAVTDPMGPQKSDTSRVLRGGSRLSNAEACRATYRGGSNPDYRGSVSGFRLALVPIQ